MTIIQNEYVDNALSTVENRGNKLALIHVGVSFLLGFAIGHKIQAFVWDKITLYLTNNNDAENLYYLEKNKGPAAIAIACLAIFIISLLSREIVSIISGIQYFSTLDGQTASFGDGEKILFNSRIDNTDHQTFIKYRLAANKIIYRPKFINSVIFVFIGAVVNGYLK